MDPQFKPRLRHCTMVKKGDSDSLTIVVGTDYFSLSTNADSLEIILRLKSLLDGRRSIAEIAALREITIDEVIGVVEQFEHMGLLRAAPEEQSYISGQEYIERVESTAIMWARQIGYHRLFGKLSKGLSTREVALGLLIESYHYVRSASRHISTAISHATDESAARILSKYLSDEHEHDLLFERGLEYAGIPRATLRSSHPTVGTMSLINMLCEIGRRSSLAYLSCTSLFEARSTDAEQAEAEFREICSSYDIPELTADLFIRHFRADLSAGHSSLLRQYISKDDRIDSELAHESINLMHDLKHAFDQYHDQILIYYEDISNYSPRPKVDFFCL